MIDLSLLSAPLEPGVICFFTSGSESPDQDWEVYFRKLSAAASSQGLVVRRAVAPSEELRFLTVARRFNIGNIDREAVAYVRGDTGPEVAEASVYALIDSLTDIRSLDCGNRDLTRNFFVRKCSSRCHSLADDSDFDVKCDSDNDFDYSPPAICHNIKHKPHLPSIITEEEEAVGALERQRLQMMDELTALIRSYVLKFHIMPPLDEIMHEYGQKFLIAADPDRPFSPIIVNGNLEIVLPYYNELIIRLTPLQKIVYLLFLRHPDGLILKRIGDYFDELQELYLLVKPGADESLARSSVADLCNPLSDSLNQKLSMIRRSLRLQLDRSELVDYYAVGGQRGDVYRIPAASGEVTLPAAVSNL